VRAILLRVDGGVVGIHRIGHYASPLSCMAMNASALSESQLGGPAMLLRGTVDPDEIKQRPAEVLGT
jgi:hypothetical protein